MTSILEKLILKGVPWKKGAPWDKGSPWDRVKSLAETAVLTRASLSMLIIVPSLNAIWLGIPSLFGVEGVVGIKLPLAWVLLYAAALIVAINQCAYQLLAPGAIKSSSRHEYVNTHLNNFLNNPDLERLKSTAMRQFFLDPEYRDGFTLDDDEASFLASSTDDWNFYRAYFGAKHFNRDKDIEKAVSEAKRMSKDRSVGKVTTIANGVMSHEYNLEYSLLAAQRWQIAYIVIAGYLFSILLVFYVILDQSIDVFSTLWIN